MDFQREGSWRNMGLSRRTEIQGNLKSREKMFYKKRNKISVYELALQEAIIVLITY